eukprot:gb/GECG01005355.1/.p1 GENE.gb/GECG01005355.1/~~gb/GECG01005355.1/.p1  ORF type:complete len:605 (+),score=80.82 gb/GECG01005355.1/:1-1815(+)
MHAMLSLQRRFIPSLFQKRLLPRSASCFPVASAFPRTMASSSKVTVVKLEDLSPGSMKEVEVYPGKEDSKILLARSSSGDRVFATAPKCTHYGAPLVKGVLSGDRIVCPWHHACFNCGTGDIEDAPALEPLQTYDVSIDGDNVNVDASKLNTPAEEKYASAKSDDERKFVIVGGGAAGLTAAQTLRKEGYTGKIVMLSADKYLPYDRVKLSKAVGIAPEKIQLKSHDFYAENHIEVRNGVSVKTVDTDGKQATLDDGSVLAYDGMLVATGSEAKRIPIPGANLPNVHTLRKPDDSSAIAQAANSKGQDTKTVVVGTGFIGMEVAAALKKSLELKNVTVIGMESVPFENVLGKPVGEFVKKCAEDFGINFEMSQSVKQIASEDNSSATGVELGDGRIVPADCVVLGVGAKPVTPFHQGDGANVAVNKDGSINTNEHFNVLDINNSPINGLWAAGDVATFPYWHTGQNVRIEHWDVAQQQGRVAAKNMMAMSEGKGQDPFRDVPFFWTGLPFLGNIRFCGNAVGFDNVVMEGNPTPQDKRFVAYYLKGDKVAGVATCTRDPVAVAAAELIRENKMPPASDITSGKVDGDKLVEMTKELGSNSSSKL